MNLDRRFAGLSRLYGSVGAERIRQSHVAVVGIGGVGSWTAEAMARSGVARITLIDLDHVSESNINRQIHALESTTGQAKVQAMRDRIIQINAECKVTCIEEFVEPENWPQLLPTDVNAVVDACDQVRAKAAIAAWALSQAGFVLVSVGAAGGKRHAHKVDIDDLANVTHDPLLARLRHRLRKEHNAPREGRKIGLACVFSREAVSAPDALCSAENDSSLNCHGFGSVVSVTATFGLCAAGWVMDQISC